MTILHGLLIADPAQEGADRDPAPILRTKVFYATKATIKKGIWEISDNQKVRKNSFG